MKKIILILLFISSISAAEEKMYFQLRADVYSDVLPIHAFINKWHSDDFQKGEHAFAHGKMRLGVKNGAWDMGWVWMYDYQLKFSQDLSELYYQVQNQQLVDANKTYDIKLKAQHIDAIGARFAYQWQMNDWSLITGLTALSGRHFLDGKARALGQTNMQDTLLERVEWLNGVIDYTYDRPALKEDKLGWNEKVRQGYGYALDLKLQGNITPAWQLMLNIEDIYSYMYWEEAPQTAYSLAYDRNSRPRFDIRGQLDTQAEFIQRLPFKVYSELNYQALSKPWSLGISSLSNQDLSLWQVNASWRNEQDIKWSAHLEPQTQAAGISIEQKYFNVKYMADHWNSNRAKRQSALLSAQYFW